MLLRENNIKKLKKFNYDVLIIGGGINGAVSASCLAAKGCKTGLIDKGDFSSLTSQNSSNLAWGGIKYLETFEFGLVRKLCICRNNLMKHYPSSIKEIRFFTTISKGFRVPRVILWLGAWLYWFIGNCFTKSPKLLSPRSIYKSFNFINTDNSVGGFEYSDCYLHDNDSRFVFNFIRNALNYGLVGANYVESLGSVWNQHSRRWITKAKDILTDEEFEITSKVLVNAAGPLVDNHNDLSNQTTLHNHVFSKGVHLIVDQITKVKKILTFFAKDGRLFFVIPMGNKTCIGTTDTQVEDPMVKATEEDKLFILDNINTLLDLDSPLTLDDVIAVRCGVRPLVLKGEKIKVKEWTQLSRKHVVEVNKKENHISIFGGKLTDCLNVGEEVYEAIKDMGIFIPVPNFKWYGEPDDAIKKEYIHQSRLMGLDKYTSPNASEKLSKRLWRRYGAQAIGLLENIREDPSQAEILIHGTEYTRCEIRQAKRREMVTKLEDFLRRRSKISLVLKKEDIIKSPGLAEACNVLFEDKAEEKLREYIESN